MITESTLYWITRLDGAKELLFGIATALIISTAAVLIAGVIVGIDGSPAEKKWSVKVLKTLPLFILATLMFFTLHTLTPTTKEMCAIKIVPLIANDEQVQELPSKFVDLANEWFEELKPNKSEQGN